MKHSVIDQVWTPIQHTALWLAHWVTGHCSYDHLTDALESLGGPGTDAGSVELVDAYVPAVIDLDEPVGRAEFLRLVRACTTAAAWDVESRPIIRLVLSGAGDVPLIPAGTEAAREAGLRGAAILLADEDPDWTHVIVPPASLNVGGAPGAARNAEDRAESADMGNSDNRWKWYSVPGIFPEPAYISPGEADWQLAEATRQAAALISQLSQRNPQYSLGAAKTPDPRLLVGALDDHLDLLGVPDDLPRRASTVLARADRVSAIVTVAQSTEFGVGSSAYDPQLIPLWRTIRQCRMSAVDYAVRNWCQQ